MLRLLFVSLCLTVVGAGRTFNLAFASAQKDANSNIFGSLVLRGNMIRDYLQKHPSCNSTVVLYGADASKTINEFTIDRKIDACVCVKHMLPNVAAACRSVGALVLFDIIDNTAMVNELLNMAKAKAQTEAFQMRWSSTICLVQSEKHAAMIRSGLGLRAYSYLHQHTNTGPWGRQEIAEKGIGERLVVGFLEGNENNLPTALQQIVLPAVCRANMTLWVINQNIFNVPVGNLRTVKSTRTVFSCSQSGGEFPSTKETFFTTTNFSTDTYGQAAFYTDEALVGVDIGLVWPAHMPPAGQVNDNMLRPPTRFLHWMSRGVPTLYYPTYSYSEVAAVMNTPALRGAHLGDRTYGHSANVSIAVDSTASIHSALVSLRPVLARQQLQHEGYEIAQHFTTDSTANRLMEIVNDVVSN